MSRIKMELVDNDFVVKAKTKFVLNGIDDSLGKFFRLIKKELIAGETAFLEIEGHDMKPVTLEIYRQE